MVVLTQRSTSVWAALLFGLLLLPVGCLERTQEEAPPAPDSEHLFCFWNVENLFDDKLDPGRPEPDKPFDEWFARNDNDRHLKYEHLSQALLQMNDGRGPDILALAEVESVRAAELLQQELNAHLKAPLHYNHVLMKEVDGGRHLATAIITRLPVEGDRTQLLNKRLRILEGHITAGGHELVVIASHWTSRMSEKTDEPGRGRDKYGDQIYGQFVAMHRTNPRVDLLVCGDFNDTPVDESVTRHLHAVGDREKVLQATNPPLLLNLMADKDPRDFGTHYAQDRRDGAGEWYIFDQIVVSPGMLDDRGWSCVPDSVRTVRDLTADAHARPWRFGNSHFRGKRGYSDHFPVTVKLRLHGS
jgi:endonuclease/exonuclease/phosphatase family metal-dependent hydrolase